MTDGHDSMLQAMVARTDSLEMRLTYQDDTIEQLNKVIVEQWSKLDQMRARIERLESRLADAQSGTGNNAYDEPPPPHY